MRALCNNLGEELKRKKIGSQNLLLSCENKKNQCWKISASSVNALLACSGFHLGSRNGRSRATDFPSIKGESPPAALGTISPLGALEESRKNFRYHSTI